jgi:antitoxin component YwqK of YwqJK toxin-antitoxin module
MLSENSSTGTMAKWIGVAAALLLTAVVVLVLRPRSGSPARTTAQWPAASVEVSRTNLVLDEGRLHRAGQPGMFTGFMVEHSASGALRSRSAISNGLLHGLSEGWYTNGQLQVTEHFREGVSHGLRTKWAASGAKISEASIVDGKLHGTFRRWHENGVLSEQVEFVAGQPQGTSLAYFPSGFLKARVTLLDGKPADQAFWRDGEVKE